MAEPELNPTTPRPLVCSVCIANYNGLDIIQDCIASVLAQECDFSFEIIVHDDASPDGSANLIRERFPQVKLIESKENVGYCISNNRMADVARGEFLLLLNNDAALAPDALATLHRHARQQVPHGILSLPQYDWHSGQLVDRGCLLDPFYNPVPNLHPHLEDVAMVIGACMWVPRTLWEELDGFPSWFGSIAEDMYLCCAARLAGHPVQVAQGSSYKHRVGYSFGGGKPQQGRLDLVVSRRHLSERNKNFVMLACHPAPLLTLTLPLHILLLLLEGVVLASVNRNPDIFSGIYWSAIIDMWRFRVRIRDLRKANTARRQASITQYISAFTCRPRKLALVTKFGLPKPCAS